MKAKGSRSVFRTIAITALASALSTGCSVVSSRPPASAPDEHRAGARCGGILYPLVDTVSVGTGFTWVLYADHLEENSRSKTYTVGPQGAMLESETPGTSYQWMRIAAYTEMAIFGASAIYGYVVEGMCAGRRHETRERRSNSSDKVSQARPNPPSNIAGFTFGLSTADAERVCIAKQQRWELKGATAFCRSPQVSDTALPVRLELELGTVHRIVALHRSSAELIVSHYDGLQATLRSTYGSPQRERAAPTGKCGVALADCLKSGEKPKGPAWYWPTGSLELQPVWQGNEMILEERYTREGPASE